MHRPKSNPCCIVKSRQQVALVSVWMHTKRSRCVLIKKKKKKGDISTLNGGPLKLVDKFTYFGSSVSSIENDINMRLAKSWNTVDRLSIIWKSDLSDKIKCNFFQAVVLSILLYGWITWMLTKRMEKKLDGNCARMLQTNHGSNIPQNGHSTATYFPSLKLSK